MFCVSEDQAAAVRAAYEQDGELSAAVELRRFFPGIASVELARACARAIASWAPIPIPVVPRPPTRLRRRGGQTKQQEA